MGTPSEAVRAVTGTLDYPSPYCFRGIVGEESFSLEPLAAPALEFSLFPSRPESSICGRKGEGSNDAFDLELDFTLAEHRGGSDHLLSLLLSPAAWRTCYGGKRN